MRKWAKFAMIRHRYAHELRKGVLVHQSLSREARRFPFGWLRVKAILRPAVSVYIQLESVWKKANDTDASEEAQQLVVNKKVKLSFVRRLSIIQMLWMFCKLCIILFCCFSWVRVYLIIIVWVRRAFNKNETSDDGSFGLGLNTERRRTPNESQAG